MSLLEFMKYMTEHPDQLNVYKRNPDAFFQQLSDVEQDRIALSEEDQGFLHSYADTMAETTTIMRVVTPHVGQDARIDRTTSISGNDKDQNIIDLTNVRVNVHSLAINDVFFAEPEGGIAECITLPHSYLFIDGNVVCFSIHLCYTAPYDNLDRPGMLYIETVLQTTENKPPYAYKRVDIIIDDNSYILVLPRRNTHMKLSSGSSYNRLTGELVLVFSFEKR